MGFVFCTSVHQVNKCFIFSKSLQNFENFKKSNFDIVLFVKSLFDKESFHHKS